MDTIDTRELTYLTCAMCEEEIPEGESVRSYGRLNVASTPEGDMVVGCERHMAVVVYIKNNELSHHMLMLAGKPCSCGLSHKKETVH
jgi:hypothetical protein